MAAPTTLAQGLEILNEARVALGYQDEPEITADNLDTIGVLPANQLNKYFDGINLILEQRFFTALFDSEKNPWRKFFIDIGKNGFGLKDTFVELIEGQTPMWDASYSDSDVAEDLVSYATDAIVKKYHEQPMAKQFKVSRDEREYSKMFTATGLPRMIDAKMVSLASSAELWLQNQVIGLIKDLVDNGEVVIKSGYSLNTLADIKKVVEDIRSTTEGATMPSDDYNKECVMTLANGKDDLFLITTPEYMERINVQDLASAYNVNFANLPANVVYAPNGTDLGTYTDSDENEHPALFILIDRRTLVLGIRTWRMTSFPIPNTLKHNNWLSIEGLKSYNTFFTAVAFCGSYSTYNGDTPVNVKNTTSNPVNISGVITNTEDDPVNVSNVSIVEVTG